MKKKSLSAKKIIHKKLLNHLRNDQINKVYQEFKKILDTLNVTKFAVAISGGPDSIALAYLSKCFSIIDKAKVNFYHVNHNLRKGSNIEANKLKVFLNKFDINCKILDIKVKSPIRGIQSFARNHRYSMLNNECKKNKIKFLLVAHHIDDIYENFLIRLLRGSGLKGLVSFNEIQSEYNKQLKILRPLIKFKKSDLTSISKKVFNFYLTDPSNKNTTFKRVRIRNLINNLKKEGLDENKLRIVIKNLSASNVALDYYTDKNMISNSILFKKNMYILSSNFLDMPHEIIFRSLSTILKTVGKKYYASRGKSIDHLIKALKSKNFKRTTLSGCIIEKISNSVKIYPEIIKKR
tara:strand:- start:5172 stop:6221 length:1050 start_codon:yes stop_codon:yes gene_type:complete